MLTVTMDSYNDLVGIRNKGDSLGLSGGSVELDALEATGRKTATAIDPSRELMCKSSIISGRLMIMMEVGGRQN